MVDFAEELVAEFEHAGELDFINVVLGVAFVAAGRLVLVVVAEDGAAAIDVAVVQGVAVPAGVLGVVGPDDFPPDDAAPDSVSSSSMTATISILWYEPHHNKGMGCSPSPQPEAGNGTGLFT